jgi:CheY-like chemotaxis protein
MSKTILHIDDEADIRDLIREFLSTCGYEIVSVSSRTEALEAARRWVPDLIIADLQLDEADGLATIDELRTQLPDTPVIMLTGVLIDQAIARETIGAKVSCYIEKTAPLSKILTEVQRLLPG